MKRNRAAGRAVAGAAIGQVLEYYDFFLYATMASLVFGKLFFAELSPGVSQIVSLLTLAVAYIFRPLGGIVAGHLGDKYGRKFVLSATLIVMGLASVCIGLLPTYTSVGVVASILLVALRAVQGMAAGGEWTGGVLLSVESVGPRRRGFAGAINNSGVALGFMLATGAVALTTALTSTADFEAWAWRIPFLASAVVTILGLYLRFGVSETREFQSARSKESVGEPVKAPIMEVLRTSWATVLVLFGARAAEVVTSTALFTTFYLAYAAGRGISPTVLLLGIVIGYGVDAVLLPISGHISDKIGARPILVSGTLAVGVYTIPFFLLADSNMPVLTVLAAALGLGLLIRSWPARHRPS